MGQQGRVTAVLGPTNTGKTHYAIERMLAHRTGVIGLPLRLLAREVYDRIVALRGPSVVALVTGEERIVPDRTQYWVCTVEAMPTGMGADFLAVDEIQLCADPERGHVFTDRLLNARGLHETLFLGSDTMRSAIAALVPGAQFMRRERFSELTYAGSKKISRMPPRAAIVGFSVENVYAIAELIRRQKGGCAVVMGALSPRTRNAQVAMYQSGLVDYLVATDAIGMGLNLDITHVAFSGLRKFDGRRMRELAPNELAQIAGRAGRHMRSGSFGVTGEAPPLHPEVVEAITSHSFTPLRKLNWRNERLEFGTIDRLIGSLEAPTDHEWLSRAREADDLRALRNLADSADIRDRVQGAPDVRLLWDVCRIPDFRGISSAEHAGLLERIFGFLHGGGRVPDDWLARQIRRIDRTDGDIDTLSKRLAYIRTWTYVAQRNGWVDDESHWRGATRAVEDRLSDALHGALTKRFVDRRTSVLLRRLKQKEGLVADVNDKGEVTVEGEFVGRLEGFRFRQDASSSPDEAKTLYQASMAALKPEFHLRADRFYNAPDTELDFTEQGGLMWGENAVGKLVAGAEPLKPQVQAFVDEEAGEDVAEKVRRRLQHFIDRKVATLFEPLLNMGRDETLTGLSRGFAFRMIENFGIIPRDQIAGEVKELDQDARGVLRKHGIRFGQFTIFMPLLLKPAPTRLRLVLWSLANKLDEFPESPPPGLVTIPVVDVPDGYYTLSGYRRAGQRAIRIDMLERLADLLRAQDSRGGFEANPDMLSITGMTLEQFADLMQGLGYKAEKGERAKVKAAPEPAPVVDPDAPAPAPIPEGESAIPAAEEPAEPEVEVYYTFAWAPRRQGGGKPRGERPQGGKGKPRAAGGGAGGGKGGPRGKGKPRDNSPKSYQARPPRKEKPIDPDNPFAAALMGLRDKK
ncbi:helicase-related protein [Actibacterium sp. XHP0104]|uniref:helicase-related protein n=1 Tax=Actibacterium sp. XHP0104 TaxID=2984335 RepID=UPI0021E7BB80|nr:helicase-related protein [Actibacterium sp. XHP0104]MCV2881443.1 helicase-related protein [Actibacterium sp. XHP0104]